MKPSERCKEAGLKSLAELAERSEESVQTLNNWFKKKRRRFELILAGVTADEFKKIAVDAMNEARVDMSNDEYTGEAMKRFLAEVDSIAEKEEE